VAGLALKVLERITKGAAHDIRRARGVEKNHQNRFSRAVSGVIFQIAVSIMCFKKKAVFKT
jgi:hypothetical protein